MDELSGQVVIGLGVVQAPLAIRAGLAGAVGAELGAIALVVGGYVQGDQEVLDLAGRDEDGVRAAGPGGAGSVRDGISPM